MEMRRNELEKIMEDGENEAKAIKKEMKKLKTKEK